MGFIIDYVRLQQEAYCVLSDSGTISEASAILDFPSATHRDSIERPEALDAGYVVDAVRAVVGSPAAGRTIPAEYTADNCSERAVNFILSTWRRHHDCSGIRR